MDNYSILFVQERQRTKKKELKYVKKLMKKIQLFEKLQKQEKEDNQKCLIIHIRTYRFVLFSIRDFV